MEAPKAITSVQHCYFMVKWLDMWGGDNYEQDDFASQDEAIAAIKKRINFNENYCGTLRRHENGKYKIYIKDKCKTNPSKNTSSWHLCQTVFYGRRVNPQKAKKSIDSERFQYFLVGGLDMYGGDMEKRSCKSFQFAFFDLCPRLQGDHARCGTIQDLYQDNWNYYMKDIRRCNPSNCNQQWHRRTMTIFYGKEV